MRASPLLLLPLTLTLSCAHRDSTLRTAEFAELHAHTSYDMEAARAWKRPATLTFELEGGATFKDGYLYVAGYLVNRAPQPQPAILFPVGAMGLTLQPYPGTANRLPPKPGEPPRMMPAPPPPELITVPALSRVRFQTAIPLDEYEWLPGQPRELQWTFQFWDEPKPMGRLPLPADAK